MSKINKNYHPNKKRAFIMVFGMFIGTVLLVYAGLISRNIVHQDYPLVFVDSNNKLMYITKSNNNKNDLASIENANIVYANNDTKYLLYTNNNALYLLDTTFGGVGTKVCDSSSIYGFSKDDKYVYYIDANSGLYLYDWQNNVNSYVTSNVSKVELIKSNVVLYVQDSKLYFYNLSNQETKLIADSYDHTEINDDNYLVLYSVANNNLYDYYIFNTNTFENTKVLSLVTKVYAKDSNYTKFIYTKPSTTAADFSSGIKDDNASADKQFVAYTYEDYVNNKISKTTYENNKEAAKKVALRNQIRDYLKNYSIFGEDIYYQNGNGTTLIASNINKLYYYDIKNQKYSYTTYHFENNSIDIASYDDMDAFTNDLESKKLNSLYFKVSTNEESMAYKNITTDSKVIIRNNDEYYLLVKDNDYYNLYYSKVANKALKIVGEVDTNLLTYKLKIDYINGYLYANYINGHYYLNQIADGKVKTIAEDVNPSYITVSEGKDSIYYLKSTTDNDGELMLYNGIRTSKLADELHSFIYFNNDLIYVTKNYDSITKTSDLYRYSSNHLTLIYKDIADWYNPLTIKEQETTEEE
jgi:hypothetical protein